MQEAPVTDGTRDGDDLALPGCTPEPLIAYLKALGVLRLVSEQKDPGARGFWRNDVFWLRSTLDRDALVKFFLEEYVEGLGLGVTALSLTGNDQGGRQGGASLAPRGSGDG